MSNFADQLAADAAIFLDPDAGLGESIIYTVPGQASITINAYVRRTHPDRFPGLQQVAGNIIDVWVAVSDVPTVTINGDKIIMPPRVGESNQSFTVNRIVNQDAGIWHLQVI